MVDVAVGGVIAALLTPYNGYGGIDTDGVGTLVEHAIASGVDSVLVNASIGEAPHLSRGERIFVFEAAIEAAAGRVPVYAGTGAVGTEETLALTWDAGKAGVAAAFVATPYYYPLPQDALLDHYRYLARRGRLPLVPVSDPAAIGNTIAASTVVELLVLDGIAGVALADGDPRALDAALAAFGERGALLIMRDSFLANAQGAGGVVSALAGVLPGEVVALWHAVQVGDGAGIAERWRRLQPLAALLDDPATGVAACKVAAAVLGLPGGVPRAPLPSVSAELRARVAQAVGGVRAGGDSPRAEGLG